MRLINLQLRDGAELRIQLVIDEVEAKTYGGDKAFYYQLRSFYPNQELDDVVDFETYDEARVKLYELALKEALQHSHLKQTLTYA